MPFSPIWNQVEGHFFTPQSLSRVAAITSAGVQAEAWFKVELISLLYQLRNAGAITSFDCECLTGNGRKKMDFKIEVPNAIGALEVKTALCAQQKKLNYDLMWYAKDTRRDSSFLSDVFKLTSIAGFNPSHRYLLVFAYRAPSIVEWNNALTEMRRKAPALVIALAREATSPCGSLSIAWISVDRAIPGSVANSFALQNDECDSRVEGNFAREEYVTPPYIFPYNDSSEDVTKTRKRLKDLVSAVGIEPTTLIKSRLVSDTLIRAVASTNQ